jgi:putative oxidoreductase
MNDFIESAEKACTTCLIPSCIERLRTMPNRLSHWFDHQLHGLAPIFPRLLLAYEFGEAGVEKLNGENWFADLSFPFPFSLLSADLSWTLATSLEIIAPIALILGFMTPLLQRCPDGVDHGRHRRRTLVHRMAHPGRTMARVCHHRSGFW